MSTSPSSPPAAQLRTSATLVALALCALAAPATAQQPAPMPTPAVHSPEMSGGPLLAEQASYDVTYYDLALAINPADSTISGAVTIYANVVHPMDRLVLDLDTVFTVSAITRVGELAGPLPFERRGGRLWITAPAIRGC